MGTGQTKWEELGISNDFLFGKAMQNPELCRKLLQRILPGLEIDRIEYPQLQKEIRPHADAKKEQVLPGHAGPAGDRQIRRCAAIKV